MRVCNRMQKQSIIIQVFVMTQSLKFKQAEYRENQIGTQFLSCPLDNSTRVFINGEIVSAQNFPQSELFISYKISIPNGWKPEISEEFKTLDLTEQESKELNCLQSITQSTLPILQRNLNQEFITKFYFCFPIDIQLLKKESTTEWPVIHFEVFSKDDWGRIRMHGCGFTKIPSTPGYHVLTTDTWKPYIDQKTKVIQYFLGGILKTKNLQEISKQQSVNEMDEPGPINRFSYKGTSSGKIHVRLNVAIQSRQIKNSERVIYRDQKYSEQTQMKKKEPSLNVPSLVNTGQNLGGRYTNTRLQ